ncbi:MAG: hypothetical protein IJZ58_09185 [Oscillospiraceae bacterium]|nr:hypothetical protein [Oscillospiraceae bacterium]
MITKSQAKRKQDIKTKLMAAIAMLLVSSIMMVSSTYAWFTLSTAPEVTGINTAVGANGNLEIALLPKDGLVGNITSEVGDSVKNIEAKNVTWGNLVDLSDSSIYGLDGITLYPAAINVDKDHTGNITSVETGFLKTPAYGSDGRVSELLANTSTGYYDSTEKDFYPNTDMGVRAVGTASGMTPRQLAYRNARSAANTAASSAKNIASQSLNTNGSTLANIAIKKGTGATEYTMDDLTAMKAIIDSLLGTTGENAKTGSLQQIENAYKNYILAFAASGAVPVVKTTDGSGTEVEAEVQPWQAIDTTKSLAEVKAAIEGELDGQNLPTALTDAIDELNTTISEVTTARSGLDTLIAQGKSNYTWEEIRSVLTNLADPENMEVNGIKAGEIMQDDNMSDLVNSVAGGGLKVTMVSGGGVYADIADHCGDYTASVVIEEVSYNGLTLKNMTARMETSTAGSGKPYLSTASAAVEAGGAPASGSTTDMPITDMFGYVIDLAFRTNAAESKLLLQQDAVDRIYGDNANEGTMGHGSNMTFNLVNVNDVDPQTDNDPANQARTLMDAIRLVFFTPGAEGNSVIVCAKLDATNAAKDANGAWKANIVLGDMDKNGAFTPKTTDANVLMDLPQNTAVQLSVLVYLDGNYVGNDDVAASAAKSLSGQLNLQFASSATLVPMDYSQLHTPQTAGGQG